MQPRLPHIPKKPSWRIGTTTAWFMLTVAFLCDLLQLLPKLLIAISLAAVGTVAWIPIFGQAIAAVAIGLSFAVDMALSGLIMGANYLTMWVWFQQKNVRIMEGRFVGRKWMTFMMTLLMEMLPFFNLLPGVTVWTATTILWSWKEDHAHHQSKVRKMKLHARRHEQIHKQRIQYEEYLASVASAREASETAERIQRDTERRSPRTAPIQSPYVSTQPT